MKSTLNSNSRSFVFFIPESDNESVPSPIKTQPQPRVPYCKTYEEIRLEEIQAESAAYYSYEAQDRSCDQPRKDLAKTMASMTTAPANDPKQDATIGKTRRVVAVRENRKVRAYPKIGKLEANQDEIGQLEKKKEISSELNFQVLTLEEIRRRKRRKALLEDTGESETVETVISETADNKRTDEWTLADDMSKDAETLTALSATNAVVNRGIKRSLDMEKEIDASVDERRVKAKVAEETRERGPNVPPVRLRRSPKRFPIVCDDREPAARRQITSKVLEKGLDSSLDESKDDEEDLANDEIENVDKDESPVDRFEENLDVRVNRDHREDSNVASRKNEVEVRLCDSSTDEERMSRMDEPTTTEQGRERKDAKSVLTDTVIEDSKANRLSCDSLLAINEDEYLMLDTASDDILKDIDALLKDKPVV